jgi:single-strand DNA-binding protein
MSNLISEIMNSLANKVQLIGNLGQDPETKTLDGGKKLVKFSLATDESYKDADGKKVEVITWHNIIAWNGLAEIAGTYLKKGRQVAIEGKISYRTYEDKNKVMKYFTEIVATDLMLLRDGKDKK